MLDVRAHKNAVSVLFRVLLELAVENYIKEKGLAVYEKDKLATRLLKVGNHLASLKIIDKGQLDVIKKFQHSDKIISANTLNMYVHSSDFAPSPDHLMAMWDGLSTVIVLCLKA